MSRLLYQGAQRFRETDEPLLVVEGMFDALPYIGSAVALLGKPSDIQVRMLAESRRPLVIALDGDAIRDSRALQQRLKLRGVTAGMVKLPPGMDPGDVEPSWLIQRAAEAARKVRAYGQHRS
jgi:DNA primase